VRLPTLMKEYDDGDNDLGSSRFVFLSVFALLNTSRSPFNSSQLSVETAPFAGCIYSLISIDFNDVLLAYKTVA